MQSIFLLILLNVSCAKNLHLPFYDSGDIKKPLDSLNILKSIHIFYVDSVTNRESKVYRELTSITDEYYSKPAIFDIKLELKEHKATGTIQIFIEELLEPIQIFSDSIYGAQGINGARWVLHEVVYSNIIGDKRKTNFIEVKNIRYKTAYFYSSLLYYKHGFRIVALYKPKVGNKMEIIKREFSYGK